VARKSVEDAEAAIRQEQEDTETDENVGLITTELVKLVHVMMVAIRSSLSNIASSDAAEDGEDVDSEETEQGKLSKDAEPSWVIGTFSNTVQQRMKRLHEKQIMLDKLTQLGWEDAANYCSERDRMYSTSALKVRLVGKHQMADDAAAPSVSNSSVLPSCGLGCN
jgi:hypothetical protein